MSTVVRRVGRVLLALVLFGAVGGTAFEAGRRAVSSSPDAPEVAAPRLIVAGTGTLVDERPVQVIARWETTGEVLHRRSGTITATSLSAQNRVSVDVGTEMFRVDQVPVIVMQGAVPAFRDMTAGTRGDDVAQLQGFLVSQGAADLVVDGTWASATTRAWQTWQRARGYSPQTGAPLGTIVFLQSLPATVSTLGSHRVGGLVTAGEAALSLVEPVPEFRLVTSAGALAPPPAGTRVTLPVSDTTLEFTVSGARVQASDGAIESVLEPTTPTVCGTWCDALAATDPAPLSATATLAGPATGVVIPLGVIRSNAQDELFVIDATGAERPITIVVQVGSNAVVDGISEGDSIEVPATVGG